MLERSFQRLGRSCEWWVSGSFRNSTIYHDPRHVKGYKVTEISAFSFFFCFKPPRRFVIFCDFYVRCWLILSIERINAICRDFPRVHLREDLWRAIYDESSTNDFSWIALTNLKEGFEERYNWLKKYWSIYGKELGEKLDYYVLVEISSFWGYCIKEDICVKVITRFSLFVYRVYIYYSHLVIALLG